MSYTYMAIDTRDCQVKAAFPRKHELKRWARLLNDCEEDLYGIFHMQWFRVRSAPWELESTVSEIPRDEIIVLAA